MHFEDIKAEIRKAGSSASQIARKFEVQPAAVSLVLRGQSKSKRIAQEVARITGLKVNDLWPGKYPNLAWLDTAGKRLDKSAAQAELKTLRTKQTARSTSRKAVAA